MCKHEISQLVGIAGGVLCKGCGQVFDHIPKQEEPKAEPKAAKPKAEKKPVKKAPAKKGDK